MCAATPPLNLAQCARALLGFEVGRSGGWIQAIRVAAGAHHKRLTCASGQGIRVGLGRAARDG